MLVDTHCHVHFRAYEPEAKDLIQKTLQGGVFMVTVGTDLETSHAAVECAHAHEGVWATVGLHPEHTREQTYTDPNERAEHRSAEIFDMEAYRALAVHPAVVAVGECGLDYYRLSDDLTQIESIKQAQKVAFRAQLDLANELALPVVIHCRDAYEDTAAILREYVQAGKLVRKGSIHCFSGNKEQASWFLELGFCLGFTGVITFPPRKSEALIDGRTEIQDLIKTMPADQLVAETDSPYLTPVPHRGERNEPLYVRFVVEKMAELRGVSFEEMARLTTQNAERLFGFKIKTHAD